MADYAKRELRNVIKRKARGLRACVKEMEACLDLMVDAEMAYLKLQDAGAHLGSRAYEIARLADQLAAMAKAKRLKVDQPCHCGLDDVTPKTCPAHKDAAKRLA